MEFEHTQACQPGLGKKLTISSLFKGFHRGSNCSYAQTGHQEWTKQRIFCGFCPGHVWKILCRSHTPPKNKREKGKNKKKHASAWLHPKRSLLLTAPRRNSHFGPSPVHLLGLSITSSCKKVHGNKGEKRGRKQTEKKKEIISSGELDLLKTNRGFLKKHSSQPEDARKGGSPPFARGVSAFRPGKSQSSPTEACATTPS